MTTRNT